MRKRIVLLSASILMTAFIFGNSLMPGQTSASISDPFVVSLDRIFLFFNITGDASMLSLYIRKSAHFTEFAVFGVLWSLTFLAFDFTVDKTIVTTLLFGFFVAIMDETIQYFVPGRAFALSDIIIDLSGVALGIMVVQAVIRHKYKTITKHHSGGEEK